MVRTQFLVVGILVCLPYLIFSQDDNNFPPPENPPVIYAHKISGNINVDGKLDESDWKAAKAVTAFFRMEPRQGGQIKYKTEVKILFDKKNLYIGAFCQDSLGKKGVRAQDLRRDFSRYDNDAFMVQLDPQNLKQYCVSFQTTPYGNQTDLQNFNDENTDIDWNALWSVRTQRTDEGYFVEFAIPFKSIRYEQASSEGPNTWGITLGRIARRENELSIFPAIPQSFSPYRMTYAAELRGLELPDPSANVRVEPYFLYQYDEIQSGGEKSSNGEAKLGGDIKWAINPRSVLDLTFNTDFAQADVDRAVNNLERFNIFFPERRQFFLENSGIWAGAANR
ncbi:MAG: sugar-binding protein, partial [Bacteroidota bacterium]